MFPRFRLSDGHICIIIIIYYNICYIPECVRRRRCSRVQISSSPHTWIYLLRLCGLRYYIFLKGRPRTVNGWEPVVLLLSSSLLLLLLLMLLSYDIIRCPVVWSALGTYIIPVIPVTWAHPSGRRERKRTTALDVFSIRNRTFYYYYYYFQRTSNFFPDYTLKYCNVLFFIFVL